MKYSGRLTTPIQTSRLGLLASDEEVTTEANRIVAEQFDKIPDLFEAHRVQYGDWMSLCHELAKAHVPGFRVSRPAGRPTEWGLWGDAEFRLAVDDEIGRS